MKNNLKAERRQKKKVRAISQETPPQQAVTDCDADIAFPIVGIGTSAGGFAAFEAFFPGMPIDSDPGTASVLVQQLATDHKSILTKAQFSLCLCPECTNKLYPNLDLGEGHAPKYEGDYPE